MSDNDAKSGRAIVHGFVVDYYPQGVAKTYHVADDEGTPVCGADVDSEPERLTLPEHAQGAICDECGPADTLREETTCPNCNTGDVRHDLGQDGFDEYRCSNENCSVEVFRVDR